MNARPIVIALAGTCLAIAAAGSHGRGSHDATAHAQGGTDGWTTFAGGDEVLALAVDAASGGDTLWAGTEGGGVVVWDLDRSAFTQYLFPQTAGLVSNDVRDIAFDPNGGVWLATAQGVTYAPPSGRWVSYGVPDGLPTHDVAADVTAVAVDEDGTVWAGTHNAGVATFDAGTRRWTAVETDTYVAGSDAERDGPGGNQVADIAIDESGQVWLAHGRESAEKPALSVFDPADDTWRHVGPINPGDDPTTGPATDMVLSLGFDRDGLLWLGTWGRGVQTYDPVGGEWGRFTEADGTCGENVWAVAPADDEVWVACADDPRPAGVARWDGEAWSVLKTTDDQGRETDLPSDSVRAIAVGNGRAWLGTNGPGDLGYGIAGVNAARFEVEEVLTTAPEAPPVNDITAVVVDPDRGDLWVGTRGAGVMHFDGSRWTSHDAESTDGKLAGDTVADLVWRDRELWVATTATEYRDEAFLGAGVSALNVDTGSWREPLLPSANGLPATELSSLAFDGDGWLWIGTGAATGGTGAGLKVHQGQGVAVYNPDADRFEDFHRYSADGRALAGDTVLGLAAADDEMWVAASYTNDPADQRRRGGGISVGAGHTWVSWFGGQDGFRSYHSSGGAGDPDPFITGDVRSVTVDRNGAAWVGTYDLVGALLVNAWPYVTAIVNRQEGAQWIADEFVGDGWVPALADDGAGTVWAATTRGHAVQEADLTSRRRSDTARGGLEAWWSGAWHSLTPANSGLASTGIADLAVDPTTGDLWVAYENGGLSRFTNDGTTRPTVTPCVDCTTATSEPGVTPTGPLYYTVPPAEQGTPGTGAPPVPTAPPGPEPPPEVPEPSTLAMFAGGLVAVLAWLGWRRRLEERAASGR